MPTIEIRGCAECPYLGHRPQYNSSHCQVRWWVFYCREVAYLGIDDEIATRGMANHGLKTSREPHGPMPKWCPLLPRKKSKALGVGQ